MKTTFEVQFNDYNVTAADIEKTVKAELKEQGIKMNTIESLEIYYTPETTSVYYVATTKTGDVVKNDEPLVL